MKKKDSKVSLAIVSIDEFDKVKAKLSDKKIRSILDNMEDRLNDNLRLKDDIALKISEGLAVILAGCDKKSATSVMGRLAHALDDYLASQKLTGKIKLRFGCATYPEDAKSGRALIKKARI